MRFLILWILSFTLGANATESIDDKLINAQAISSYSAVHLIFIDVWQEGYSDTGPVKIAKHLEQDITPDYLVVWVIPKFNITNAQIANFLRATPEIGNVFIDERLALMRNNKVRNTPTHILLNGEKEIFRGNTHNLLASYRNGEAL